MAGKRRTRTGACDQVVSILGTLAGSVLGFYFGSRGSQS